MFRKNEQMPCLTCISPIFLADCLVYPKSQFQVCAQSITKSVVHLGYTFDTVKDNKEGMNYLCI